MKWLNLAFHESTWIIVLTIVQFWQTNIKIVNSLILIIKFKIWGTEEGSHITFRPSFSFLSEISASYSQWQCGRFRLFCFSPPSFLIRFVFQPATSEYIVKDTGNCSPRYLRCTINQVFIKYLNKSIIFVRVLKLSCILVFFLQIPCTYDLLATSGMQLALLVQPLALPHPSEEPIQVMPALFYLYIIYLFIFLIFDGIFCSSR